MQTETKICKDCKYWSYESHANKCNHELALVIKENINFVTGEICKPVYRDCCFMRSRSNCGEQVELFEPRVSLLSKVVNFIKGKINASK